MRRCERRLVGVDFGLKLIPQFQSVVCIKVELRTIERRDEKRKEIGKPEDERINILLIT